MQIQIDRGGRQAKGRTLAKGIFGNSTDVILTSTAIEIPLGKKEAYTSEKCRRAAAKAIQSARAVRSVTLTLDVSSFRGGLTEEEAVRALTEGARLSTYRFERYKSKSMPRPSLERVLLLVRGPLAAAERALGDAETVCGAVSFTRDLANEPANVMTPPAFAQAVSAMARKTGLRCRIIGKAEMKKLGMGGILGVSQGSSFAPQLVILENRAASNARPVVLVGKGITFDTGGISLKPGADMDKMKFDMCGAAAVAGTMMAVAKLKLKTPVVGIMPVCENMPGSTAQRPGDILKISNGKTVEVLNTDAEGRLILADALVYAKRYAPKALIDIATLTGACAATFSDLAVGLMGTDDELIQSIRRAGERTGERCWELPLWEEYGDLIRATYADIQNISKRNAGTITAGMFLKEFAEHTKAWAHLDIAGTAWNNGGAKPLSPIGATGIGVRLFVELLRSL